MSVNDGEGAVVVVGRLVSIVGLPGTGKTWLRLRLGERLDVTTFAIDDERERLTKPGHGYAWKTQDARAWSNLRARLRGLERAVVETAGTSTRYPLLVGGWAVLTVRCVATADVRYRRLRERERIGHFLTLHQRDYAQRMTGMSDAPLAVDLDVEPLDPRSVDAVIERSRAFLELAAA